MCSQLVYNRTGPQTKTWHLYLRGLGTTYPKHCFVDTYMQKILNSLQKLYDTQICICKHLVLEFLVGRVLVGVNPCGSCEVVAPLPQIAMHPKKSQNNGLKICELIWACILPLYWIILLPRLEPLPLLRISFFLETDIINSKHWKYLPK